MREAKEISILIKDDEKRVTHKFLEYEDFMLSSDDPIIKNYIDLAMKSFEGPPETVRVTVKMEMQ